MARLLLDRDMTEAEAVDFAAGEAVAFSARGPEKSVNEDGAALVPVDGARGLLAVADGLGGQPAGDRAAKIVLKHLAAAVEQTGAEAESLRPAILDGIERANHAIQELRVGAGTTLVAVEVRPDGVRPYHIGDSEVLIVGQRGKVKLQTVSHSPVGYGVHAGLIDEREAMVHEERHLLTNLVGAPDMRIEVGSVLELRPRDTVLLASDGLFDNLRVDEIVRVIRAGPLKRAASRLAEDCLARMRADDPRHARKPDDLTFVLFRRRPPRRHS